MFSTFENVDFERILLSFSVSCSLSILSRVDERAANGKVIKSAKSGVFTF